jgi:centrosomal protein CEP76
MDKYQDKLAADSKEMYSTAKKWWSKAMKSNPYVKNRLNKGLKLLSVDESGQMKMVCHFISPIAPPRSLNGPRFAARLVSLIPYMKEPSLFGTKADACWSSTHAFLAKKCGSVEDHALLLCSLLLGWGLNAYVAMGLITSSSISENTNNIIPHTWVVTIDSPGAASRVVFWETITGQQYVIHDSANASSVNTHHYRELHALFRHDRYYLNMQRVPALAAREGASKDAVVSFNLSDQQVWNPFPFTVDASQTHPGCLLSLTNSSKSELALIEAELELEAQLKDSLAAWRGESGLPTYFDDALSTLLQPALAAYEFDRCTGVTFGNADFQASIKRCVPTDLTHLTHCVVIKHINHTTGVVL